MEAELKRKFLYTIRFYNNEFINLQTVQAALQEEADSNEIPVTFDTSSSVSSGSLLKPKFEDVLILTNPENKGCFMLLIRIRTQGKHIFMDVYIVK